MKYGDFYGVALAIWNLIVTIFCKIAGYDDVKTSEMVSKYVPDEK